MTTRVMLSGKQQGVLQGMVIAALMVVTAEGAALWFSPSFLLPDIDVATGVVNHARWLVLLVLPLLINIALLAKHRFFHAEDIDGSALSEGSQRARLLQATLQNTLEQTVLAFAVQLIWLIAMPIKALTVLPVAALLFLVGRTLFMLGYARGAAARSLGFALTFYSSVFLCVGELIWFVQH
ncbi:MAPEG family protein [Pokkaliibacter sp. MBI-7]|uniref:MAPEG family protein n=1 Tax=Pokkaliibacter sp. MBI-7 TaxID=3040600 RepID=UPI00244A386C|nr:MAPEG family protein [Pokkaliibacter sp. MBI-7]MDH2434629.1 MAPEG family protein [Pokkaliibacter sp. MBI-7]